MRLHLRQAPDLFAEAEDGALSKAKRSAFEGAGYPPASQLGFGQGHDDQLPRYDLGPCGPVSRDGDSDAEPPIHRRESSGRGLIGFRWRLQRLGRTEDLSEDDSLLQRIEIHQVHPEHDGVIF